MHLPWQTKILTEIEELSSEERKHSKNLVSLPTLQAVIKEALRLHPPFTGPFERVISNGGENIIDGIKPLSPGTRVWSSNYVMNRLKQVWGDDAETFNPGRWLQSTPEQLKNMEDMYFVFGRGSRNCVGKEIAWKVLEKVVITVRNPCILSTSRPWLVLQYHRLTLSRYYRGLSCGVK